MFILASVKQSCLLILLLLISTIDGRAQGSLRDSSINLTLIAPGFAMQLPAGDLKDRFGVNSNVGIDVIYKHKSRWLVDLQGSFIFGSKVNQPGLFSHLVTNQGDIVGTDGKVADVRVFERGYVITLSAGKMVAARKPNPNCGFFFTAGAGYLRHKIRVEDKNGVVPALQGDYRKGYDRMSSGWCLRQSVGYIYISNRRLANFFGALEAIEGFTKGRRSFNYDDELQENGNRIDILTGIRLGWILPLYKAAPEKYYIN